MDIKNCSPAIISGLITQLQDAVYVLTDHKVIYANAKMAALLDTTVEELEGQLLLNFVDQQSLATVEDRYRRRVQGEPVPNQYEIVMRTASGQTKWVVNHVDTFTDENGALVVIGSMKDVTEVHSVKHDLDIFRKQHEERLFKDANFDSLTGLANRLNLINHLKIEMKHQDDICLILIGFTGLREINDSLGYDFGDHLIVAVARRLLTVVDDAEFLARVTGVQFAVVISGQYEERINELIDEVSRLFKRAFVTQFGKFYLNPNLGISLHPGDAGDEITLLSHAHAALSHAKMSDVIKWIFYDEQLNKGVHARIQMLANLREAIKKEQFELFYQPQITIGESKFVGAEALIRWKTPDLGYVAPGQFLAYAESTDLIIPIGDWVITQACKQAKALLERGYKDFSIGINLSAKQFASGDLVQTLKTTLGLLKLPPRYVDIEVTESTFLDMGDEVSNQLQELHTLGLSLSIDDFGTGYSSLSYLQSMTFNILKIDQSFISRLPGSENDLNLVKAIINMSKALHLEIIAEGVETEQQLNLLEDLGCDIVQGYYISRPMPADEFLLWLESNVRPTS
jgi:diguanylate cyclase (GGDEF)-like protein/PAS domain S-box-containing protein